MIYIPDHWDTYTWIVVVGALLSFAMAWGIGANDVANAFGTSVGAKTINLWQACLIAAIFEFIGSMALGGEVTKTIAGGIARPDSFLAAPEVFAFGQLCALGAAMTWVVMATYWEMPVSTTHSIIGAVVGFALVWGGGGAIVWADSKDSFPYVSGIVPIVISWFTSPILSGIIAFVLFFLNRLAVLRRENPVQKAMWALPILLGFTVFINLFFVFYKGANKELQWDANKCAWVAGACGGGSVLVGIVVGIPLMRWKLRKDEAAAEAKAQEVIAAEAAKQAKEQNGDVELAVAVAEAVAAQEEADEKKNAWMVRAWHKVTHGLRQDIHAEIEKDEVVNAMHQAAEVFDPHAERVYSYLQVFSACCVSFAHGANDVANAVGPFAAIWYVYNNFAMSSSAPTPKWILAMGGAGIVAGLAMYGYNIMRALGVKMAKMTPSRGFAAELATALTVSVASTFGLPISTTHCIVGAEVGVGLAEGVRHGTNWKLFAKVFSFWVMTLVIAGLLSAAFFAQGIYAPSAPMLNDIEEYENYLKAQFTTNVAALNATNLYYKNNNSTKYNPALQTELGNWQSNVSALFNTKVTGYVFPDQLMAYNALATGTMTNNSVLVLGYNKAGTNRTSEMVTVPAN